MKMHKTYSREELTGRILTVAGPIAAEDLGVTITHEHLLSYAPHIAVEPTDASVREFFCAPVTMNLLGKIRFGRGVNRDNCEQTDPKVAIEEASLFRDAGGATIIDATSIGIGRDPKGLARISETTGLNIVMGASYYVNAVIGPEHGIAEKTEDAICEEILSDIFEGVDGTGIHSGMIGEVGCSWPLHENERKILRASGRAQVLSGAPLMIHPAANPLAPTEIVEVLDSFGVDLSRTIICHIDRTIGDKGLLKALAESGVMLEYDLFGYENSYYAWPLPIDMPNDAGRLRWLEWLMGEGHGAQILMSHDIFFKDKLVRYGGHGYAHILNNVVPLMRRMGFAETDISEILVENPKRMFSFV